MQRKCVICDDSNPVKLFLKFGYSIVQCSSCGLVYVDIDNSAVSPMSIYNYGYYSGEIGIGYSDYLSNKRVFQKNFSRWLNGALE